MNGNYVFGAGGFQLGDRVEVITTQHRGILINEMVHLSGCNTYQVLFPTIPGTYREEKMKISAYDYLLLRRLEPHEAVFGTEDNLTDETIFSPKGTDVNEEWLRAAMEANKEPVPEIDEAIGTDEIKIQPGMEVWHKIYNKKMLVCFISREIYAKELSYGLTYMAGNKEIFVCANAYALIPLQQRISLYTKPGEKTGPMYGAAELSFGSRFSTTDFARYGDDYN